MMLSFMAASTRSVEAAGPDPVVAGILSAASTIVPISLTLILWAPEDGLAEDVRFNTGMISLGLGSILGPSIGGFYAGGQSDTWITLLLRTLTGSLMLSGIGLAARGEEGSSRDLGQALAWSGAIPTGLLAIYDLWTVPGRAEEAARRSRMVASESAPTLYVGAFSLCQGVSFVDACR
jgi:hypothetical protein